MIRRRPLTAALLLVALVILAGCSTTHRSRGGGYYKDDGPEANPPANILSIPDAVPKVETYNPANSRPYVVFGKRYVPITGDRPFQQKGVTSWYGKKFHGVKTANGETYDMYAMTAAHPTLPIPSYARVTRVSTGKSVIVRINDRGPFLSERVIDLSYAAAAKLDILKPGSAQVVVQAITNDDIRRNSFQTATAQPEPAPVMVSDSTPKALPAIQTHQPDTTVDERRADIDPVRLTSGSFTSGVYLQFGAFAGAENAQHLAQRLNQNIGQIENRHARVETANNLHKVQIGPYPSRTAAVNAAALIQEATGMQPTIAVR